MVTVVLLVVSGIDQSLESPNYSRYELVVISFFQYLLNVL